LDDILSISVQKGIITRSSAARKNDNTKLKTCEKMKGLGLNLDPKYFTFHDAVQTTSKSVNIRIITCEGPQRTSVNILKAGGEKEAFYAADLVRKHILETGKKPSKDTLNDILKKVRHQSTESKQPNDSFRAIAQKEQSPKNKRPIPSEVNPPNAQREQLSKSKETTGIFSKIKMWLFG
jgi:hypothetical protein